MIAALTNHLWQSTLFAVAAGLLTLAFRRNRAQVRFWLWFSASIKFFIPFALLMSVGSRLEWAPAANAAAAPDFELAIEQVAQPFPETVSFTPRQEGNRDWLPPAIFSVWACGFMGIAPINEGDRWLRGPQGTQSYYRAISGSSQLFSGVAIRWLAVIKFALTESNHFNNPKSRQNDRPHGKSGFLNSIRRLSMSRLRHAGCPTPPGLNWDLFPGPPPMRPFNEKRFAITGTVLGYRQRRHRESGCA